MTHQTRASTRRLHSADSALQPTSGSRAVRVWPAGSSRQYWEAGRKTWKHPTTQAHVCKGPPAGCSPPGLTDFALLLITGFALLSITGFALLSITGPTSLVFTHGYSSLFTPGFPKAFFSPMGSPSLWGEAPPAGAKPRATSPSPVYAPVHPKPYNKRLLPVPLFRYPSRA